MYRKAIEAFKPRIVAQSQARLAKKRPIFFDLTTSAGHKGRWTGISRVEMALARALMQRQDSEVIFTVWDDQSGGFFRVPPEWLRPELLSTFRKWASHNAELLEDLPRDSSFIVGGSAWMQNSKYASCAAQFAVSNGLRLSLILHDLIPIKFPFWFNEGYAPVFRDNLAHLLRASSHVIAVSNNTKRDTELYALEEGLFITPVSVIREGDNNLFCDASKPNEAEELDAAAETILAHPFVLSVGAIHTRKNHRLLHEVWVKLAERLGEKCPKLVIVGGIAWNGRDVARALREDRRISRFVHILDDVSDNLLKQLYNSCLLTVYPSLYEGWGLPVAESLVEGRSALLPASSSVPEIAPDCTDLLDPVATSAWVDRIQMYATSRSARAQREAEIRSRYTPYRWSQTADALIEALEKDEAKPLDWTYTPGTVIRFGDAKVYPWALRKGWHPSEKWGVWAASTPAVISLQMPSSPSSEAAAVLVLVAQALAKQSRPTTCDVAVNGRAVGRLTFRDARQHLYTFYVPRELCSDTGAVDIELRSRQLIRICDATSNKKDERQVGVGVAALAFGAPTRHFRSNLYVSELNGVTKGLEPGQSIDLIASDDIKRFFEGSVIESQEWGIYRANSSLRLTLPVHDAPEEDLHVTVVWRGVAAPKHPLNIHVIANGRSVSQWTVEDSEVREDEFIIPAALRNLRQPIEIDFVGAAVGSPKALGLGSQDDAFSLGIFQIGVDLARESIASSDGVAIYKLGTKVCARSSRDSAPVRLLDGWLRRGSVGLSTRSSSAALALTLDGPCTEPLMLSLCCRVPRGEDETWSVSVAAGEHEIARSTVKSRYDTTILAAIPAAALNAKKEVALRLKVDSGPLSNVSRLFPASLELISLRLSKMPSDEFGAAVAFGDAYRYEQMWAEASEHYRRAVTLRPEAAGYHVQLGHMLKECGRYADAEQSYFRARELEPQNAEVIFQLGHLMKKQGDAHRAYGYYQQAVDLDPESEDIRNHLNWALEELSWQTPESSSVNGILLGKQSSVNSVEAEVARFLELGNGHAERGNWSLAIECYERACLLLPNNAELWRKLSEAQLRGGLPGQAAISQRQSRKTQEGQNEPKENGALLGTGALKRAWQAFVFVKCRTHEKYDHVRHKRSRSVCR